MLGFWLSLCAAVVPLSTLRVQVVDDAGKPCANVPLAIRSALVGTKLEPSFATTREDGLAEFLDVDRFFTEESRKQIPVVVFEFPMSKEDGLPLLMQTVPTSPLRLELPIHGSVIARVRTKDDKPCPIPTSTRLVWVDLATGEHRSCEGVIDPKQMDAMRFPYVGLGVEAHVEARTIAGDFMGTTRFRSLKTGGEEHSLVVQLNASITTVVGRALREDGEVLADQDLAWWMGASESADERERSEQQSQQIRTDSKGRFSITTLADRRSIMTLGLRRVGDQAWSSAWVRFPTDPDHKGHLDNEASSNADVGNVRLMADPIPETLPILLDGLALDARDEPISGARVSIVERVEIDGDTPQATRVEWRPFRGLEATTSSSGSFAVAEYSRRNAFEEIRHWPETNRKQHSSVLAIFEATGRLPEPVEIVLRETRTLHVHLLHPWTLEGSLTVGPGIRPQALRVELVPAAHQEARDRLRIEWLRRIGPRADGVGPGPAAVDSAGNVRWTEVPTGQFELRVSSPDGTRVLYTHADIRLGGEPGSLPTRLPDIDLREKLK